MTISMKKIGLTEQQVQETEQQPLLNHYLGLIGNVEVECMIRLGTIKLTIEQLRQLKHDEILALEQKTTAPVEILVNNHVIAKGELMSIDEQFAVQIIEIAS